MSESPAAATPAPRARTSRGIFIAALGVTAALLCTIPGQAQGPRYTVTDLGTPAGFRSVALGLNDANQVVGIASAGGGVTRGFFYDAGTVTRLGTFGGRDSFAYRISNTGVIVGRAQNANGEFRAFVSVRAGALTDITAANPLFSGGFSTAAGVSRSGLVVGYQLTTTAHMAGRSRIFLFSNSTLTDLATIGGLDSVVSDINDGGEYVGFYATEPHADYASHRAFRGQVGGVAQALGSLGGRVTTPTAINNAGQFVGYGQLARGEMRAFLYTGGQLVNLGTLAGGRQSYAYGLNEDGDIVGASDAAQSGLRAVLYTSGGIVDLNTQIPANSGWRLTEARAINAAGVIVGTGVVSGRQRAFMLTPAN